MAKTTYILVVLLILEEVSLLSLAFSMVNLIYFKIERSQSALFLESKGFGKSEPSRRHGKKASHSVSETPSYTSVSSDIIKTLIDWLEEEEVEGLESVEIGISTLPDGRLLRGLFATQNFAVGEYILAVPFVSTLLVHEEFEENSIHDDEYPRELTMASKPQSGLQLWHHYLRDDPESRKQYQKYKAYFDCLPMWSNDPNFVETPDFWTDEEIQLLRVPSLVHGILSRKRAIQHLADEYNSLNPNGVITLSEMKQSCWIMQTRGFTTLKRAISLDGKEGLLCRVVLIPLIDFVNHGASPKLTHDNATFVNTALEVLETEVYNESFYALVATEPIRKGQEIRLCYGTGQETSIELYTKYGFWPSGNQANDKAKLPSLIKGVNWNDANDKEYQKHRSRDILSKSHSLLQFLKKVHECQ
jgi:hypothetical protein